MGINLGVIGQLLVEREGVLWSDVESLDFYPCLPQRDPTQDVECDLSSLDAEDARLTLFWHVYKPVLKAVDPEMITIDGATLPEPPEPPIDIRLLAATSFSIGIFLSPVASTTKPPEVPEVRDGLRRSRISLKALLYEPRRLDGYSVKDLGTYREFLQTISGPLVRLQNGLLAPTRPVPAGIDSTLFDLVRAEIIGYVEELDKVTALVREAEQRRTDEKKSPERLWGALLTAKQAGFQRPVIRTWRLPQDIADWYLERLEDLERSHRWIYGYGSPREEMEHCYSDHTLAVYLHLSAARAFALLRSDGVHSDEVRSCLERARWAGRNMKAWTPVTDPREWKVPERVSGTAPFCWHLFSSAAVLGLVLQELSLVRWHDCQYEESLVLYVDGLTYLGATLGRPYIDLDEHVAEEAWENRGGDQESARKWHQEWADLHRLALDDVTVDLDLPVQVVNNIFAQASTGVQSRSKTDWKLLARLCQDVQALFDGRHWDLPDDCTAVDIDGDGMDWNEYWVRAQERAKSHMNPGELRELLEEERSKESERRLRTYFFGDALWKALPDPAKEHLVTAEQLWYSGREGAARAALDDLQLAAQSLCYHIIWQPLRQVSNLGPGDVTVKRLKIEGHEPTLWEYGEILEEDSFPKLVDNMKIGREDKHLLLHRLKVPFQELAKARNVAQHRENASCTRVQVTTLMRVYLGVGHDGILPRLAAVGLNAGLLPPRRSGLGPT